MGHEPLSEVKTFINESTDPSEWALIAKWVSNHMQKCLDKGAPHDFGVPNDLGAAISCFQEAAAILESITKQRAATPPA